MVIVMAADEKYFEPLTVALFSLFHHLSQPKEVRIILLNSGIKPEKVSHLKNLVSVFSGGAASFEAINPDTEHDFLFQDHYHFSRATYLRLIMPQVLPPSDAQVLYLDCDLIVCDDLKKLWDYPSENVLSAIMDFGCHTVGSIRGGIPHFKNYNLTPDSPYFNTGVLKVNLRKWRSLGFTEQAIDYLKRIKGHYRFPEQDALNIVSRGEWTNLPKRWNVQTMPIEHFETVEDSPLKKVLEEQFPALLGDPGIIHFIGPEKPWHNSNSLFASQYFKYLHMSRALSDPAV